MDLAGLSAPFLAQFQPTLETPAVTEPPTSAKPSRKRNKARRRREERGLPADKDLQELALSFLQVQHDQWPELVASGVLPAINDQTIADMVVAFKARFLNDRPLVEEGDLTDGLHASTYLRYSDDGSNSRSNLQQLGNVLQRARRENRFIPWALVFADSAITGTIAKRRGYEMAKEALAEADLAVTCLYLDDIGRGNRDIIETMTLGQMIWALNKRLVGVSDGFDSDMPLAKLILAIFGFFQEWFIEQLRAKVNRGMADAFNNGTNTGVPSPGFKLVPRDGVQRDDGEKQVKVLAIDEAEAKVIVRVFHLYANRLWSPDRIGKFLNRIQFAGSTSWDGSRVRKLLRNRRYLGILTYRETYQVRDKATGGVIVKERDRKEWLVRRQRDLQIISYKLWKIVQRRLAVATAAWAASHAEDVVQHVDRVALYAKTLFRPLCDDCKATMVLGGNAKYPHFHCLNGKLGRAGCKAKGYKSVAKFEKAMLEVLLKDVLTDDRAAELTSNVGRYLNLLAQEPKVDTSPLKAEIRTVQAKIKRLVSLVVDDEENEEDLPDVRKELVKHQKQLASLNKQLREVDVQNVAPPASPTEADVRGYMDDLRGLLQGDVARAADVLRQLAGPIFVSQEKNRNARGYAWTAHFSADLVSAFVAIDAGTDSRKAGIWEYLKTRLPISRIGATTKVNDVPKYEEIAPQVHEMLTSGANRIAIASHLKITAQYVDIADHFFNTRERPKWKSKTGKKKPKSTDKIAVTAKDIALDVARLRDKKRMSWAKIGAWFLSEKGITTKEAKLRQAYDHAHPERTQDAVEKGQPVKRGEVSCVDEAMHRRIRKELAKGTKPKEIANKVSCSVNTVYREKTRIRTDSAA